MPTILTRKINALRDRWRHAPIVTGTTQKLRETNIVRKRRNTRFGKWIYSYALRARAQMKMDPYEVILPLDKEISRFESILERGKRTKNKQEVDKLKSEMEQVMKEIKQAIFWRSVRRAMTAAGVKSTQRRNVQNIMRLIEAGAVRPFIENQNMTNRTNASKRLKQELGMKYWLFNSIQKKAFAEASEIITEYINEKLDIAGYVQKKK